MRRRSFLAAVGGLSAAALLALWWPGRWRYIVVHHSGGRFGDLELLKRVHRERQGRDPIDMIPYHFVIGNGQGMEMGEVAKTERWTKSLWGAHVKNPKRNFRGIGICLIGNYETDPLPEEQYQALVSLVRDLMTVHRIGQRKVTLHGKTPGENSLCPGQNFPETRFFRDIA